MQKQKVDQMPMPSAAPRLAIGRCRTELSIFQVIGHVVIWFIIAIVTFGIGALFWPYAAAKMILESIVMTDEIGHPSAAPLRNQLDDTERPCLGALCAFVRRHRGAILHFRAGAAGAQSQRIGGDLARLW